MNIGILPCRAYGPERRGRGGLPILRAAVPLPGPSAEPSTLALQGRLAELGSLVEGWLREALHETIRPPAERFGAMLEYHLGWRGEDLAPLAQPADAGKKLRPALALLVCESLCGSVEPARSAAVAVELLHNFSLVHDDIQDESHLRRHRSTLWRLWGAAQGINAGDALFTLAQLVILDPAAPAERAHRMALTLNDACLRLVEGQFLDIELQQGRVAPSPELYEAMIGRKTGALFACACRLGAQAANASDAVLEAYAAFGMQLGVAFQEQDDVLGVWGAASETGKPDAADVLVRKKGLPAVLALARDDAPEWLRDAYAGTTELPRSTVERAVAHFDTLGLRATVEERVSGRYRAAVEAVLAAGGREPARSHLLAVCEALVSRRA